MKLLGIETSCDETAVAVVEDGRQLHSNVIASQIAIHKRYGGVVPEVASRQHILQMMPVINEALDQAKIELKEIDAVAVTYGPGLAGALIVGVNTAKAIAMSMEIPLIGVNHLEGHLYAAWLDWDKPEEIPGFPLVCLIASGGHTDLLVMAGHGQYTLLGRTRDDAAGEAFDKAARILGLGFPGGPEIQKTAQGTKSFQKLPRAMLKGTYDFSFSGVKTALLHTAQRSQVYPGGELEDVLRAERVKDLAAAFQDSVVDVMVIKTIQAAIEYKAKGILLGGGVTANAMLRSVMHAKSPVPVLIPAPVLCTDNGAMVAACGYFHLDRGLVSTQSIDVDPGLNLG
ncbi:tRNA (adenosine(37)-N6)-threonylcarbamoyltransferase complex transferase subunit TsaD [SAR202 cluster bacterium AD-804-J14_MRT_500m]|nr:tRNA (adenosine(37)-N6)-threonylcarbamoyltransferase complex transferase subunit TsaD [SAR202 cluster bacterium AD-804-J14_MRT_500m]